jgi:Lrp/AsnC family leucine-responsive transcriptional regulator
MEQEGLIGGYTVQLKRPADHTYIDALISLSINPSFRDELLAMLETQREVLRCYHVTGDHSFLIMVSCSSMEDLEHIIMRFQKLGQTNTQIILSTPVDRSGIETLLL